EQRETAERLSHLIESSPYGVYVHTKGVIRLANEATVRLFGATAADGLVGRHTLDFVHPDDMAAARVFADKQMPIARNGEPIEQKRVRLDGSVYWGEISSTRITWEGEDSFLVFLRDVTDRVTARAELEKTRERLDDAIDSMPNGFALFDERERFVFANDKFVSGDPVVEQCLKPGTSFVEFITQALTKNRARHGLDDDAALERSIRRTVDHFREATAEHEFEDGVGRWFLSRNRRTKSGATVVTNTEITDRKRAEQRIKDNAEQLRLLLENAPYAILVQTKGIYRLANPAALRMFGARTADDLLGRKVLDLVHPDDRATVAGRLQRLQGVAPTGEPVED
ncbi:MAG: PAS domain-containing protein, partial [Myxococcota bacterium]